MEDTSSDHKPGESDDDFSSSDEEITETLEQSIITSLKPAPQWPCQEVRDASPPSSNLEEAYSFNLLAHYVAKTSLAHQGTFTIGKFLKQTETFFSFFCYYQ
ncbi:hypothetical protein PoB_001407400 [Plakobranchus ocellatus]|uniref:Uncharacterized protein n=1 Tax=Plakobranchus ocellatus TaxID=259542 RepID=A0AAV3YWY7_9GAST|nr:hypothetical protein PoB_001407400 [Plakobranchus ocellatus]